jgi:NadR type nicotinamide-nucleotide adenylyltransferase
MAHKIAIIGGESTGKSTLCKQLASVFETLHVDEFARAYLTNLDRNYIESDLLEIAKGQLKNEYAKLQYGSCFLFCDTDLNVLKVWSEHKYNRCHAWILNKIAKQDYDAYIVTAPDLPWQPDVLREHPDQRMREYFFNQYVDIAIHSNKPFVIVRENEEKRLANAKQFIRAIFA